MLPVEDLLFASVSITSTTIPSQEAHALLNYAVKTPVYGDFNSSR
jgi:hypothetical protein